METVSNVNVAAAVVAAEAVLTAMKSIVSHG
jgi:hypothetical protein